MPGAVTVDMQRNVSVVLAIVLAASSTAWADQASDQAASEESEAEQLGNLHVSLSGEASTGQGGGAVGFRGNFSYDVVHGGGAVRPAVGLGITIGGANREIDMAKGAWGTGVLVVGSIRYHEEGKAVDRRVFATIGLLREHTEMTAAFGERVSIGGNWLASVADHVSAHPGSLVWILPHQIEGFYQHQLGSHRLGLALGYGF